MRSSIGGGDEGIEPADFVNRRFSPAEKIGFASVTLAAALAAVHPPLAAAPLACFVGCCGAAPFLAGTGWFLPVVSRGARSDGVSLTFDDGPDPDATPALLRLLRNRRVRAAFFVVGEKADRHPDLIRAMLADGHAVGNHSLHHDPALMLRRPTAIFRDIAQSQRILERIGGASLPDTAPCAGTAGHPPPFRPLTFRPVAGVTNPSLGPILERLGLMAVTYSLRARDGGRRRFVPFADRLVRAARPGDIVALHDAAPRDLRSAVRWLREVDRLVTGLRRKGLEPVGLDDLLGRPVMAVSRAGRPGDRDPESRSWPANGTDAPGTGHPCPPCAGGVRENISARA